MGGPPICIGSFHPLFFVHVVVITHTHMHMHRHVHTRWLIHTPTLACKYRLFSWLSLPATCTGNRNDWYMQFYSIPVPSGGHWYGQPTRKGLHEHAYIYLHITGARHAHWGVMYVTHCIPWLCNHSHATTFVWSLIWYLICITWWIWHDTMLH